MVAEGVAARSSGVTLLGPSQKSVRNNQPACGVDSGMDLTHRTLSVRRTAALVAATAAAALAIPAAANAAVTGAVTGDTATLTGDAANDNIIISVNGGNLRHNRSRGLQLDDRLRLRHPG